MTRREFIQGSATSAAAAATTGPLLAEQHSGPVELPFAVVFEVQTTAATHDAYLETARKLRPMLDEIPGFVSIERSSSLSNEHRLLSLSYWADEAALVQWRSTGEHHAAQQAGRDGIFADYRLRVGPVLFDDQKSPQAQSEPVSRYNRPPFHARRYMSLVRVDNLSDPKPLEAWLAQISAANSMPELHGYHSLSNPGRDYVTLSSADWAGTLRNSIQWKNTWAEQFAGVQSALQTMEVERDYGMEVREQAPQFFRPTGDSSHGS